MKLRLFGGGVFTQGAQEVRGAIKKLGINDRVEVSPASGDAYGIVVKYSKLVGSTPHIGELSFSSTQIREGLLSKPIFESSPSSATSDVFALFVFGLDPRLTINLASWDPLIKSASDLYRCRMQNESETACANERVVLQEKVIDRTFAEAKAMWDKMDTLLTEARKRDDNDSDLDALERIVLRYAAARPILKPATLENAKMLLAESQKVLREFESHPALKSLVLDEGDCHVEKVSIAQWQAICLLADYHYFVGDRFFPNEGGIDKSDPIHGGDLRDHNGRRTW